MQELNKEYLDKIKPNYLKNGYPVPKWIQFSEAMIDLGCQVELHQTQATVSKYIYLTKDNKKLKIRFSNHKANHQMETKQDCDYYVGVGNYGVVTTEQLIVKLKDNFETERRGRTNKEIANLAEKRHKLKPQSVPES
jgi:hypothetical protein